MIEAAVYELNQGAIPIDTVAVKTLSIEGEANGD